MAFFPGGVFGRGRGGGESDWYNYGWFSVGVVKIDDLVNLGKHSLGEKGIAAKHPMGIWVYTRDLSMCPQRGREDVVTRASGLAQWEPYLAGLLLRFQPRGRWEQIAEHSVPRCKLFMYINTFNLHYNLRGRQ